MDYGFGLNWDFRGVERPRYIAVEGPIGVGKTTLARHLAETFGYQVLLEETDKNPFLEGFYTQPGQSALPTQLFFLFQRIQQLQDVHQDDLFESAYVADFLLAKDRLFAEATLDKDEFLLYSQIADKLNSDPVAPDLVLYLQAPTSILMDRIHKRGVGFERAINPDYLDRLNDAYTRFFLHYDQSPLLIVNAKDLDLANNVKDYKALVEYLLTIKNGRHFYNPAPLL
ncbi:deoxynucleoside kinase [Halioxenophilus sp. WMMB6]|uniref:deoxynucleoside kinase n=1 Tax=Halioxenophilus sp. WMMB6 TaxID=3073815 RepID=UPI00295E7FB0|nr:deoxynucleoside kinase [Halioxenophilus sp. WMMB6]